MRLQLLDGTGVRGKFGNFLEVVNGHGGCGTTGDENLPEKGVAVASGSVFWAVRTVQSRYSAPISAGEVWVGLGAAARAEISPLSRFCAVVVIEGNGRSIADELSSLVALVQ